MDSFRNIDESIDTIKSEMVNDRENINGGFILKCNICGETIKFNNNIPISDYTWNNIIAWLEFEGSCYVRCKKCDNKGLIR